MKLQHCEAVPWHIMIAINKCNTMIVTLEIIIGSSGSEINRTECFQMSSIAVNFSKTAVVAVGLAYLWHS